MKCLLSLAVAAAVAPAALAFPLPKPPAELSDRLQEHIRRLEADTEAERLQAVSGIRDLGPWGVSAVPALAEVYKEASPRLAVPIAELLATYGPAARSALPILVEVVRRPQLDRNLLMATARAIAALGDARNREMVRACMDVELVGRRRAIPLADLIVLHPADMAPVVAEYLAHSDAAVRGRAALNLALSARPQQSGKKSPLVLLSPEVRQRLADRLRAALDDPDPLVRAWAVAGVLDLDPASVPAAVPAFVTVIRREDSYELGLAALIRTGPQGARALLEHLNEPNLTIRRELSAALARFGGDALPALLAGTRHPDPRVREGVLAGLTTHGEKVRPAVAARLADEDSQVRLTAATTLVALKPDRAWPAVPVLVEAAFSRVPGERSRALYALESMKAEARPAVPAVLRRIRSGDRDTRFAAARVLAAADRSTWPTYVPVLVEVLGDGNTYQKQTAARVLAATGPHARAALPALRMALAEEHPMTRILAAEAVARITPDDARDAVRCLADLVVRGTEQGGRRRFNYRRAAVQALRRIGPPAKAAVPALVVILHMHRDEYDGLEAALAIIHIDPAGAREAYDTFRHHLSPHTPDPDEMWLDRISLLGKSARPLLPDLIMALKGKDAQRNAALEVLAMLGPDAKDALPALRELAKGTEPGRVPAVIQAIAGKQ